MSEKPTLNIVLVEPRIPQNTGNVARTCACTACRLHLVGPMGFAIDDKKLKHAGLDYWHYLDINYYDGLEDSFYNPSTSGNRFFRTESLHCPGVNPVLALKILFIEMSVG